MSGYHIIHYDVQHEYISFWKLTRRLGPYKYRRRSNPIFTLTLNTRLIFETALCQSDTRITAKVI